jgi:hypothetical protein
MRYAAILCVGLSLALVVSTRQITESGKAQVGSPSSDGKLLKSSRLIGERLMTVSVRTGETSDLPYFNGFTDSVAWPPGAGGLYHVGRRRIDKPSAYIYRTDVVLIRLRRNQGAR